MAGIWRAIHFWAVLGAHFWLRFGFIKKDSCMNLIIWLERFGGLWEGFWAVWARSSERFWRGLEALGGAWATYRHHFWMLELGLLCGRAPGGS